MKEISVKKYSGINISPFEWIGSARKRRCFLLDLHFREAFEDLSAELGEKDMKRFLTKYVPVIFKPESLAARKIHRIISILAEKGFKPVTGKRVAYNRNTVRAIWQYQFNAAARGRIDLVDMIMTSSPSLYMLFAYRGRPTDHGSAVELLAAMKGGAKREERHPGSLRHYLGWINEIMNYVHIPDDPADLIREMGILFTYEERQRLLNNTYRRQSPSSRQKKLSRLIQKVYNRQPKHDLSFANSIQRITQCCKAQLNAPAEKALKKKLNAILEDCFMLAGNKQINWKNFYRRCKTVKGINIWDVYTIITTNAHLPPEKNVEPFF